MAIPIGSQQNEDEEKRRSKNDLLLWFALLPFIIGSLFCVGEVATLSLFPNRSDVTASRFGASYLSWPFVEMPPVDMNAVVQDIRRYLPTNDPEFQSPPDVGILIQMPKSSSTEVAQVASSTPPPEQITPAPTVEQLTPTAVETTPPATTPPPVTPPPNTVTPVNTPYIPPPPPEPTSAPEEPTAEPPTVPPTLTDTPTPETPTPETPTPVTPTTTTPTTTTPTTTTPTTTTPLPYEPIIPIAEGNGASTFDPLAGGCRAYFGYLNNNPQPIQVTPVPGSENFLSPAPISGTPPTEFKISRVFAAFSVVWNGSANMVWTLNGNTATALTCVTPSPP